MKHLSSKFRFRLSTLLTVLILAGIPISWYVARAERQKNIVAWLHNFHGDDLEIWYDYQGDSGGWDASVKPAPDWLVNLVGLDYFATVTFVKVRGIKDVSKLTSLKRLESLYLYDYDNDLEPIHKFKRLEMFALNGGKVWDWAHRLDHCRTRSCSMPCTALGLLRHP